MAEPQGPAASSAHRYAVAWAPSPGTLGWLAGSHWLGRCAAQLRPLPQLDIAGVAPEDLHRLTAAPRRRGWQAPLLAPFSLAVGADWLALHHGMQALAHRLAPLALPHLHVERVGDALALVLPSSQAAQATHAALEHIAQACGGALHPLSAPPCEGDTPAADCGAAQPAFRFHLPLTGPLDQVDAHTQALVLDAAQEFFADLPPLTIDSLALFAEPAPGADFALLDHLEMGA